jgi:hypothetical protein
MIACFWTGAPELGHVRLGIIQARSYRRPIACRRCPYDRVGTRIAIKRVRFSIAAICGCQTLRICRSGVAMGGGQRRPDRPFPVTCVLAAHLPAAANSQQFGSTECAGPRPISAKTNPAALGERLNASTTVSGHPTPPLSSRLSSCPPDAMTATISALSATAGASRNLSTHSILRAPALLTGGD